MCHSSDDAHEVWLGCENRGDEHDDVGTCKHATGWFHPRCVGLGAVLVSEDDVAASPSWQCPWCDRDQQETNYAAVFLKLSGDDDSSNDDSDSDVECVFDDDLFAGGGRDREETVAEDCSDGDDDDSE